MNRLAARFVSPGFMLAGLLMAAGLAAHTIVATDACPAADNQTLFGFDTSLSCDREEVEEGGATYGVYSLQATARQGNINQAVFVRCTARGQTVDLDEIMSRSFLMRLGVSASVLLIGLATTSLQPHKRRTRVLPTLPCLGMTSSISRRMFS